MKNKELKELIQKRAFSAWRRYTRRIVAFMENGTIEGARMATNRRLELEGYLEALKDIAAAVDEELWLDLCDLSYIAIYYDSLDLYQQQNKLKAVANA